MFRAKRPHCWTSSIEKDAPLDLWQLEDQVRDRRLTFKSFRACQHGNDACCHGHQCADFVAAHITQLPRLVKFVR